MFKFIKLTALLKKLRIFSSFYFYKKKETKEFLGLREHYLFLFVIFTKEHILVTVPNSLIICLNFYENLNK